MRELMQSQELKLHVVSVRFCLSGTALAVVRAGCTHLPRLCHVFVEHEV